MKPVCFSLMGHGSVEVSDFIKYCYAEAISEGLDFYVSPYVHENSVSIILDGLCDEEYERFMNDAHKYALNNTSMLFIQTEIVRNSTLDSGAVKMKIDEDNISHPYEDKNYWDDRFSKFNCMLPFVDHIACMHYLSHEYLKSRGYSNSSLLPMRYHDTYAHQSAQFNYDRQIVDFLFSGSITQHRMALLGSLQTMGYRVYSLPSTSSDDWRLSLAKNSKIYLGIKHGPVTPQASVMRIYWALMNEVFAMHEQVPEPNELDPYYLAFNKYSDLVSAHKLKLKERREIASDLKADFRNRPAPDLTLGQVLKKLAQS